jgi:tetratricopeptide (TPR) repeat protein
MVERIIARAGGVPLYVEELAKTVTESTTSAGEKYLGEHIPESLQASLMARLDRLGDAKHIAQIGAVIGRDFSYGLIAALTETGAEELDNALERITASELISCKGTPPDAVYTFKHALIQDAAYQSLLIAQRDKVHLLAGEALENQVANVSEMAPEIIALHYSHGGDRVKAARFWLSAAQPAARSSATQEAISHFRAALSELEDATESDARTNLELAAWVGLGPLLMATQGVGSPAVSEAYESAVTLAEQVQDGDQLFRSKFNIWHVNNVIGDCRAAKDIAQDLITHCDPDHGGHHDDGKLLQAHHASWSTAWLRGDFVGCQDHLERGAVIYDPEKFEDHKFIYAGHDPGVCCHMFSSWLFVSIGDVDQALHRTNDAFALCQVLDHPYTSTVAYLGASLSMRFLGLSDIQKKHTADGIELCEAHGLMAWLPILKLSRASLATRQPDRETVAAGVEDILESHKIWTGAGAGTFMSWFHYEVAQAKLALGDLVAAEDYLGRAKQSCDDNDERWLEPDIYSLEACLKEKSNMDSDLVSQAYAEAESSARNFGAKLAGLKSSTAHARFLYKIGNRQKALDVLRNADTIIDRAGSLSIHDEKNLLLSELS